MTKWARLLAFGVSFLAACAARVAPEQPDTEWITDAQGRVIGHKMLVKDTATGEERERAVYYVPRYDEKGQVVAYEESVPDGVIIRAPDGKKIGVRYRDLRTRGSNPSGGGVTITVLE
jgi:hypothetical protein